MWPVIVEITIISIIVLANHGAVHDVTAFKYSDTRNDSIFPSENISGNRNRLLYSICYQDESHASFECIIETRLLSINSEETQNGYGNKSCPLIEILKEGWILDSKKFPSKLEFLGNLSKIAFIWTEMSDTLEYKSQTRTLVIEMSNCSYVKSIVTNSSDSHSVTIDTIIYEDTFDIVSTRKSSTLNELIFTTYSFEGEEINKSMNQTRPVYSPLSVKKIYPISKNSAEKGKLIIAWNDAPEAFYQRTKFGYLSWRSPWKQLETRQYSSEVIPKISIVHDILTLCGLREPQLMVPGDLLATTVICDRFELGQTKPISMSTIPLLGKVIAIDVFNLDREKFIFAVVTTDQNSIWTLKANIHKQNTTLVEEDVFSRRFELEKDSRMRYQPILTIFEESDLICYDISYVLEFGESRSFENSFEYSRDCVKFNK
ncbi:hypothetical protein QAD02_001315 [Eretmocerus hayati]|uniref:Uncharacterized protein n=1 Tax=Eretmocerus hayati TaxID=131215 RepID=A0ACC2NG44_9HYME|nr:hypothetical protein QAD02_001315 [Eretmocerus hayati]